MSQSIAITCRVNGSPLEATVPPRLLLSDFLRHTLELTGTHVGCEHGVCGACTVIVNGDAVRSCLMFAVQADGSEIRTVEGLAAPDGSLSPLQTAFRDEHGLQCGFCTPGILMSLAALGAGSSGGDGARGDREDGGELGDEVAATIAGHLCRCTGYRNIERAARSALEQTAAVGAGDSSDA